jgi:hypothetical protein
MTDAETAIAQVKPRAKQPLPILVNSLIAERRLAISSSGLTHTIQQDVRWQMQLMCRTVDCRRRLRRRIQLALEMRGTSFLLTTDPDTVRAPDVAFVARERYASLSKTRGFFPGPPDLAVEVISPTDTYSEVEEKVEAWLNSGCRVLVVVNPRNRTLKVYRSTADVTLLSLTDTFLCQDLLPGFELPVSKIFR